MFQLVVLFVLLLVVPGLADGEFVIGRAGAPKRPAHLATRVDFEPPARLLPPHLHTKHSVPNWRQVLLLKEGGAPWLDGTFNYNVPSSAKLSNYAGSSLESVVGPQGRPTTALLMKTLRVHPQSKTKLGGLTRNAFLTSVPERMDEVYIRYWLKLQEDLTEVMPQGKHAWRQVMEWKEVGDSGFRYRWNLNIQRNPNKAQQLFWRLRAQKGTGSRDKVVWEEFNFDQPVVPGRWFPLELYWKRSAGRDGRLWAAAGGQVLFDHRGPNRTAARQRKWNPWNPLKLYTGEQTLRRGPVYQWVDDLEVYTNVPRPGR